MISFLFRLKTLVSIVTTSLSNCSARVLRVSFIEEIVSSLVVISGSLKSKWPPLPEMAWMGIGNFNSVVTQIKTCYFSFMASASSELEDEIAANLTWSRSTGNHL